jgi:2-keto-4-pentenoate hydratase/2-oxohepta-3-ene-1,7-dioic acid hydratase in catechol pathway
VSYEDALDCVLGYTVANDVSGRCWQSDAAANHNGTHGCLGNTSPGSGINQWSFSKSVCSISIIIIIISSSVVVVLVVERVDFVVVLKLHA